MESVWSDIRCRRYLGVALVLGVAAFMRSERYVCSCFARVDLPDVGNPVTMMSFHYVSGDICIIAMVIGISYRHD